MRTADTAVRIVRRGGRAGALLVLPVLLAAALTACGSAERLTDEGGTASSAASEAEPTPAIVTFSETQKRTGDLILVNKEHAYDFDANAGVKLVKISEAQTYSYPVDKEEFSLSAHIMPELDRMIRDCDEAMGTSYTSISSAWRSGQYQQDLWDEYKDLYGEEYVKKYVAEPGKSEHHTGLALDLGITYEDGSAGTFSESDNAGWMAEHCGEYGFVRRYAEDKTEITGISNEAWHFRYVGQPHASYMLANNLCLEEYLELLAEKTSPENPLSVSAAGGTWSVFRTQSSQITEPEGAYTVSGDNMGGYIVTVKKG